MMRSYRNALLSCALVTSVASGCTANTTSRWVPQPSAHTQERPSQTARISGVHVTEIPIPSGIDAAPVIVSVSGAGNVYFGSFDANPPVLPMSYCYALPGGSCPNPGFWMGSYAGGTFTRVSPQGADGVPCANGPGNCCPATPQNGCRAGQVSAIDAKDFPSIVWASEYDYFYSTQPGFPWGELEYGASGTASVPPPQYDPNLGLGGSAVITSIVAAADGRMWIGGGGPTGATGNPATLPSSYYGESNSDQLLLTRGPHRHVWGLTHRSASESVVFEFAPKGSVLHAFTIPSYVAHISGNAHAVWFTDFGRNAIGKMDGDGNVTEYAIPTNRSGAFDLAIAPDQSVWFTESSADKVGRLKPNGTITELPLPTPNAVPAGIDATVSGCARPAIWVGEIGPMQLAQIRY
ncbi:MAG: hypothetical protein JOY98_01400 [Candidatus Eremiobacteraeota bacterium]|nr:hypothetical protein [Candidatus Eremiobacteraeota bacterium]